MVLLSTCTNDICLGGERKRVESDFYDLVQPVKPSSCQASQAFVCLFVLVLRPSQPNGVMSRAVSLPNHTYAGQA